MANLCFASISFPSRSLSSVLRLLLSSRRRWNCSLVVVRRPPELSPSSSLSASTASKERPRIGLRRLHSPPSSSLLDWLARRRSPFPQPSPSSASTTSIDARPRLPFSSALVIALSAHWPSSPPQIAFVVVVVDIHEEQGRALGPHAHVVSHPLPSSSLEELARSSVAILSLRRRYARSAEERRRWLLLTRFPLSVVVIVAQGFDVVPHPLHPSSSS
ncbi:hypothetical protein DFP72DRAFT_1074509 [Ephemerocybe angulata]|uniref:Uncharacterized protein n=1 Tax=Ephemerocybe angulata TaxID=980116 RepID=A0A8H6HL73_9AGAR|nr:hypothetical protein DFP72DRAFT_1074509 [Tulosesus angulatus]